MRKTGKARFQPNAIVPAQVARLVGVSEVSVSKRIRRGDEGGLELVEFLGTTMVSLRSALRWKKARETGKIEHGLTR